MTKALFMSAAMGAGVVTPTYVDEVFSTYLYAGNGSTQTITNGIDLAGQGGLVWLKSRSVAGNHILTDTARGANDRIFSNLTSGESSNGGLFSFTSGGFSLGGGDLNQSPNTYASWTFRKAPKFFDVVTWTGNATNRDIAHSLGVAPGCIMVKRTDTTGDWQVYHRSLANTEYLVLNDTAAKATGTTRWNSTTAGASTFRVGTDASVNASGGTYVAYVFAHDAATDGMIQCGTFTTDGSGAASVSLGWEPQFLLHKGIAASRSWYLLDNLRGWPDTGAAGVFAARALFANATSDESGEATNPNATGFQVRAGDLPSSETFVYIAIRRPNKPPTAGTQVFAPVAYTGTGAAGNPLSTGFAVDLGMFCQRTATSGFNAVDRLRGPSIELYPAATAAESSGTADIKNDTNNGLYFGPGAFYNTAAATVLEAFRRAPGFLDVVCDTGTGSAHTIAHNLGVVPELIIRKGRSGATDWQVYCANLANTQKLVLNSDAAVSTDTTVWNSTTPTASVFTVGTGANVNTSTATYISYLFATLAGISKVGTYTGNGSSQTINCGFTTGARFVLIKRTNSTGDWFVWDTARGIVSGNDPHLSLNSSAAEVTTNDTIDPATSGFIVNQVAATNVNVNAATYIYLAIA